MEARRAISQAVLLAIVLTASGCAWTRPEQVADPNEITLPNAMKAIACGVKTYQNELSRLHMNTGALQDTMEVTLALKASATGSSQLVIDAKPSFGGVSALDVNAGGKLEDVGSRENTIHIVFKNIYTAALNDPGKTEVKKHPPSLAPGPTFYAYVDQPCESVTDPVSVDELRRLYKRGPDG